MNAKLSTVEKLNSTQYRDEIVQEAVDRMSRSKNIIIRGAPEIAADNTQRKIHDSAIVKKVLETV
ncbi:hypothetical protein HHI36_008591, partial [Cryptolaemus montrouzieri]